MSNEHDSMKLRRPAFSIVEVVFLVAIVAILGGIALPRYAGFIARQQTESAARRITSDLSLAQRQARITSTPQRVVFQSGDSEYQLPDLKDMDRKNSVYTVDLSGEPYNAVVIAANFGAGTEIVYDGFGSASQPGTIVVGVGRFRQVITVDGGATRPRMTGRVTAEAVE